MRPARSPCRRGTRSRSTATAGETFREVRAITSLYMDWGGHVIIGCPYPSGKGWGFSRYYAADGRITLEGGYVFVDGKFEHTRVLTTPG